MHLCRNRTRSSSNFIKRVTTSSKQIKTKETTFITKNNITLFHSTITMSGRWMWCACESTGGQDLHFILTTSSKQIKWNNNSFILFHWLITVRHVDVVHLRQNSCGQGIHPNIFIKTNSLKIETNSPKKNLKKNSIKTNHYQMEEICTCVRTAVDRRPFFPFPFPFPPVRIKQDHVCDQRIWTKILKLLHMQTTWMIRCLFLFIFCDWIGKVRNLLVGGPLASLRLTLILGLPESSTLCNYAYLKGKG